jgi:hypothetical protein
MKRRTLAKQMTLRDWFAGQFAMGFVIGISDRENDEDSDQSVAINAYQYADAMIRHRDELLDMEEQEEKEQAAEIKRQLEKRWGKEESS